MRRLPAWLALIVVLWLAAGLRFYRLDAQSFWNDEGNSARLSERSLPLILEGTASDIHPPLYYLLLHGWRQATGESEFALRALSAFAGVGVVAGTFALGLRLFGQRLLPSLLAALLAALNPALVYYGQEARMYSLLALFAVLSTLLLWRLRPWLEGRAPAGAWLAGYLLVVVAGLYTHYFFPALLLAHNLLFLLWWLARRAGAGRMALRWAGVMGAAFLAYLPWLPIFWRQAGGRPGYEVAAFAFLEQALRWLLLGTTVAADAARWGVAAGLVVLLLGLMPGRQTAEAVTTNRQISSLKSPLSLLILLLVPILFMLVAGTTRPAYSKFMVVAVPFLALLLGRGLAWGWQVVRADGGRALRLPLLLLLSIAGIGVLGTTGLSLWNLYFEPAYARADYRGMAARIAAEAHPNAGVILNAANQWEVFTYYHDEGAPVYPIPRGYPERAGIEAELTAIAARHDRLYALFWGEGERDPERLVERWLDAHAYKATEEWVGDVRFVTYAVPAQVAGEPATQTAVWFGDKIKLTGHTLQGREVAPGDIVQLTLFWEAAEPLTARYKVFLHLVDDAGHLVAQRDGEPGGGQALTTSWAPGARIVDNHGLLLPPDTAPGRYTLRLGLYELGDPAARLPATGPDTAADFYQLGTVTVRP